VRKYTEVFLNRRELFAGALRYATLGLMAVASAALFAKRQRLIRNGRCINSGICAGCKVLQDCSLPHAVSARDTLAGVDNGRRE
jgi:hypothetical protein